MAKRRQDISVIVSTRNRAPQLEQAIRSIERQELENQNCELIVVDNGSTDHTQSVLNQNWAPIPITSLYEKTAGKSRALNQALDVASGELIVFTDDDVTASQEWLKSMHRAFVKYGSASGFCGPIVPSFPPETPEWLRVHRFAHAMFARFELDLPEGDLPLKMLPFGANFAVRSAAINNMKFSLALGPSEENGPLFGEDTEFVCRLRKQSQQFIYVPRARVMHHITRDRIKLPSLFERAFHLGRASITVEMKARYRHPDILFNKNRTGQNYQQLVEKGLVLNYNCGQIYQFRGLGQLSSVHELMEALERLQIRRNEDLLSESALRLYRDFVESMRASYECHKNHAVVR